MVRRIVDEEFHFANHHARILVDNTIAVEKSLDAQNGYLTYSFAQIKDGLYVRNNYISVSFYLSSNPFTPGGMGVSVGNWSSDIAELNLYDPFVAQDNGIEYVLQFERFTGPECDLRLFSSDHPLNYDFPNMDLYMFHGRLLYQVDVGKCENEWSYPDADQTPSVVVDGAAGDVLFINRARR